MTESRPNTVLVIDAGMGANHDISTALAGTGLVVATQGDADQAQIEEFAAGLAQGTVGNVVYLFDALPGFETPTHAHIRAQALLFAPKLRVNAICSADIEQWPSLPLGSRVQTQEIVGAVRFILDTASITGQVIALGG